MLEDRLKNLRKNRLMSLAELGKMVGKSPATISRYENNLVEKMDLDLIEKIAEALDSSSAYLLGMTDDSHYVSENKPRKYAANQVKLTEVLSSEKYGLPEIPAGSYVQIRDLKENEDIIPGGYYYIEFNGKKVFRLAVHDQENGVGFLPMTTRERRIAYDKDYVKIIGKAISVTIFFEDEI